MMVNAADGTAAYYRARAAEMRARADEAQTEDARASFLQLEASWLRLAEAAEKSDPDAGPEIGLAPQNTA
jgi:hypothetical protein